MRRAGICLAAVLVAGFAALTFGSAAASRSRCVGVLADQYIFFDERRLISTDGKAPADRSWETETEEAKIREALSKFFLDAAAASKGRGFTQFSLDGRGIPHTLAFSRTDNNRQMQKIILAERSSEHISQRSLHFCRRSETTDLYRKIYRYQRDGDPARDITMICQDCACTTDSGGYCTCFDGFVDCLR